MSGVPGAQPLAMAFWIARAVAVEPVKATPETRGSEVSTAPITRPWPGSSCSAVRGTPASSSFSTPQAAIAGVVSAGLASTALPAARAAAIWPVKIASGKFHGEMQVKMPRGPCSSRPAPTA